MFRFQLWWNLQPSKSKKNPYYNDHKTESSFVISIPCNPLYTYILLYKGSGGSVVQGLARDLNKGYKFNPDSRQLLSNCQNSSHFFYYSTARNVRFSSTPFTIAASVGTASVTLARRTRCQCRRWDGGRSLSECAKNASKPEIVRLQRLRVNNIARNALLIIIYIYINSVL